MVKQVTNFQIVLLVFFASCAGPRPYPVRLSRNGQNSAVPVELQKEVTIEDALTYAWVSHPVMERVAAQIREKHGEKVQQSLWPRPNMGITYESKKDRESSVGIEFAQKIELGGKRRARVNVADQEIFLREKELVQEWLDIRAGIKESAVQFVCVKEIYAVMRRIREVDVELAGQAQTLFKAGKISESEYLIKKENAEQSGYSVDAEKAVLVDAGRQFMFAAGITNINHIPDVGDYSQLTTPSAESFENLLAMARTNNPAFASARARKMVAFAKYDLARASRWFDVEVQTGYRDMSYEENDEESTGFKGGLALDLPIWDRSQGEIASAHERLAIEVKNEIIAALDVSRELSEIFAGFSKWVREASVRESSIYPSTRKRHVNAENAFKQGKISKSELLLALRDFLQAESALVRARMMSNIYYINLERIAYSAETGL
ncbi:TolC family protein [Verrucomicrobiota bacterium]